MAQCAVCVTGVVEEHGGEMVCTSCGSVAGTLIVTQADAAFAPPEGTIMRAAGAVESNNDKAPARCTSAQRRAFRKHRTFIEMGAMMKMSPDAVRAAEMRMRELESKGIKARKSKIFMAGCLYMQCRKDDTGHVIRDFTSLVSTDPGEVLEFRKFIVRLERYEHVPPTSSQRSLQVLLDRYAAALKLGADFDRVRRAAHRILDSVVDESVISGKRAGMSCATVLFAAAKICGVSSVTEDDVMEVCAVAKNRFRARLYELLQSRVFEQTAEEFEKEEPVPPLIPVSAKRKASDSDAVDASDAGALKLQRVSSECSDDDGGGGGGDGAAAGASAGVYPSAANGVMHFHVDDADDVSDLDDDEAVECLKTVYT